MWFIQKRWSVGRTTVRGWWLEGVKPKARRVLLLNTYPNMSSPRRRRSGRWPVRQYGSALLGAFLDFRFRGNDLDYYAFRVITEKCLLVNVPLKTRHPGLRAGIQVSIRPSCHSI